MTWKLWLDDQCHDPNTPERHAPEGFVACWNIGQALTQVRKNGLPSFMDLDHDMGEDDRGIRPNGMAFLRSLQEKYPDGPVPEWRIHSKNPEAAKNMESFLKSWQKSLKI